MDGPKHSETRRLEPAAVPDFEDEDTRSIVLGIAAKIQRAEGASTVWRTLGGIAVTVALALGAWGVGYAQQAAVDHERVERLESDTVAVRRDLDEIQRSLSSVSAILERVERRLDRREEE